MRHPSTPILAHLILALLLAAVPSSAREIVRPDLSGHWVLDADRSTAAREPGAGRSGGGDRPERDGGAGARRSGAGPGDPRALREHLAALERAAAELEIRREGAGFVVRDGLGREWPVTADGGEQSVLGAGGEETFVRSEWQERDRLKIWRVGAGAPTTEQTLQLADEGATLLVETRLTGGRGAQRAFTRYYGRAPAADATPDEPTAAAP
jgi:hypothetical protein